jgi:hypothetical protein
VRVPVPEFVTASVVGVGLLPPVIAENESVEGETARTGCADVSVSVTVTIVGEF